MSRLSAVLPLLLLGCSSSAPPPSTAPAFALVEVFTSEGCDSCPVADEYVNALVSRERASGRRVFAIAWHVDYWDELGWKDPYSAHWATERQQPYEDLNKTTIGTPEMFVNGASGTYETKSTASAIEAALQVPAPSTLALTSTSGDAATLSVAYTLRGAPAQASLWIVLVERGLTGHPTAGELAGRDLTHENVARARVVLPAVDGEGSAALEVPTGVRRDRSSVIGFVQTKATLRIVGATQLDLH